MSSRASTGPNLLALPRTHRTLGLCTVVCLLALCASNAGARDLYTTTIEIPILGADASDSTNKLKNVPDFFDLDNLGTLIPGYLTDPTARLNAKLDLRGVKATITFEAGSNDLIFQLGDGGPSIILTGSSREEAADNFEDFLLGQIDDDGFAITTTDLLQAFVLNSPVDPVAGNPNSLQSKMAFADYAMGTRGPLLGEQHPGEDLFGIGAGGGFFRGCAGGECMDVVTVDLPTNYTWHFKDSNFSFLFDFPIAATFTEDQWSIVTSIGLGFQYRPQGLCQLVRAVGCALTAVGRVGGAGSIDVGALAVLYSVSLTNHMEWELAGLHLGITNYFGYSASIEGIEIEDFAFNYDLENGIFRNGGYIGDSFGVKVFRGELGWELFGADTRYVGTDLFMDSSAEVGLALVTLGEIAGARYNKTRIATSYVWGRAYDGVSIKLDFLF